MKRLTSQTRSGLPATWPPLLMILSAALLVRLITYNGAFGSDEILYFERAAELARGEWTSADYNGALRYGFNLPAAGFIALFGETLFVANLWPLVCSLVEVGAVYVFASAAMNQRAATFSALLLATAPLHIAVATRIHADPVVSMFVTLGFVLLYFGAAQRRASLLFAAGISIGGVFWAKELAAVTWFAFLPMLWFLRDQWRIFIYVIVGATFMMLLHGAMMLFIAGDPLHLVKVVLRFLNKHYMSKGLVEDNPTFYLRYLFFDLRHTGALGILALVSAVALPRLTKCDTQFRAGILYTFVWWIGLLAVLSLFPVSLSPLRFAAKQSNYITLFLAPTALLAGMTVATFSRVPGQVVVALCVASGVVLGALQQADYRAFTANSKALAAFAIGHPRAIIIGSSNNSSLGSFWAGLSSADSASAPIFSFRDFFQNESTSRQLLSKTDTVYAVIDRQTVYWFAGNAPVANALPCWKHEQFLEPTDLGLGNKLAELVSNAFGQDMPFATALSRLAHPLPAAVYRVSGGDVLCKRDIGPDNQSGEK